MKEAKSQTKLGVGIEALWKAFAKDLSIVIPKVMPSLVRKVEILEGNCGLGTVYLLEFGSDLSNVGWQKEKVAIYDESLHHFGLQVIEGGHLNHGFSSYTTIFQLTATGESETLVDVKVVYETEAEETHMPEETTKSAIDFIKCVEKFLLK